MKPFVLVARLLVITVTTGQQRQGCIGHVCKNNGTLEESSCECICPAEFSGINCEYEIERSYWPPGPYAIPTAIDGCPESYPKGWTEGYINITTLVPWGVWITQNHSQHPFSNTLNKPNTTKFNIAENRLHITYTLGPYGRYTFQFNFCLKSKSHTQNSMHSWPSGDYSIYEAEDGCPTGFDVDNITVILTRVLSVNYDGDLPNIDITYENEQVNITISICQRLEVEIQNDTPFLADTPFMLLKGKGNCVHVKGFKTISEVLQTLLLDQTDNTHIIEGFVLQMCYYTPMTYVEETVDMTYNSLLGQYITSIRWFSVYKDYFTNPNVSTWEMHSIEYTHVLVSEFQRTDRVPWILLDLKQRTPVQTVYIRLMNDTRPGSEYTSIENLNHPEMYLSNEKWSFLNNGAILGRKTHILYTDEFIKVYQFLKHQTSRYLSIVATNYKTDVTVLKFILMIQQINMFKRIGGKEYFCFRELGMFDGIIKDNQLSATSWQKEHPPSFARQYLNGWCPVTIDADPYLQVDLLVPTTINGITVDNGYRDDIYEQHEHIVQVGMKSFRLMYGIFQDSLKYYTAVFERDIHLPYTEPITNIFRKPFLARYIRVYPQSVLGSNRSVCVRLELLGCAKKVILSKQCDNNSIIYPSNETNVLLSPDGISMKIENITGWTECLDQCMQSVHNCSTLLYRDEECIMFTPSNTSKYVKYEVEKDVDILTSLTCITEIDVFTPVETIMRNLEMYYVYNEDSTIQINKPGVLTSIGYPYHYFPDQLYVWNITLADGEYIRLIFSNISLHVYKETTFDIIDKCKNDIAIVSSSEPDPDKNWPLFFDNTWNGATPTIPTHLNTLYVQMRSCFKTVEKAYTGIGFRAIVKKDVIPNCFTPSMIYTRIWNGPGICTNEKMTFGSFSYFGFLQNKDSYDWIINIEDTRIIILKIIDFNVNCQQGASFKVADLEITGKVQWFCNTNRPVGPIISMYNIIRITYIPPFDGYHQYFDGFYAEYSTQPLINPNWFGMSVPMKVDQTASYPFEVTTKLTKFQKSTGCSSRFNKCIVIYPTFERSWQEASNFCWSKGIHLLSIHSQLEFQFVRQALVNFTQENLVDQYDSNILYDSPPRSVIDPLLYSYIGLRRYTDDTGKQDSLWEDGTPLTFTAWGKYKAVEVHKHQCTRMGFHLLNEANTWEPTDCDVRPGKAGYFICQHTYNTSNNENNERQGLRTNASTFEPAADVVDKCFKCDDGTFISTLSVCDGLPDCFDWSDERNCTDDGNGDEEMFQCDDGRHIHISYICNYVHDCYDGSDEFCVFSSCQSAEFQCANKQCVPKYKICDASLDCLDGSDEIYCGTCNTSVAFQCGDLSCVPLSQVCDNHADCSDSADEQACDQYEFTNLKSCSAIWEAGYRENGTYALVDGTVECQFYLQPDDNGTILKVWTILHDMYIDYNVPYNNGSSHEMKLDGTLINNLKTDQFCHQKIEQICKPELLAMADYDGIYKDVLYTKCICKMRIINHQSDKMQDFRLCSELNEPTKEIEVSHVLDTTDRQRRYILHPVVCNSEFKVLTKTIKCVGSHHLIPYSRRCLYSTDISGHVNGCRSLTHLQDCETFQCPRLYVKCPNSFCIAVKHICDGTNNCPGGQDEENCWCRAYTKETVIMFDAIDIDVGIQKAINKLAKQLYMSSQIVRVLKIKDTTTSQSSLDRILYISDETINANDERSKRYHSEDYTVLSHELTSHIRNSFTRNSFGNSIIIIQQGMSLVDLFQIDEDTDSDTLYIVIEIDATISKKAQLRKESQITKIKIRKFEENLLIEPLLLKELCKEPDNTSCNGMYKCTSSHVCIYLDQVCDADRDCPYGDDEFSCQFTCPDKCKCKGLVVDCVNVQFQASGFRNISTATRSLDLSYNNDVKTISFTKNMTYMYRLNISHGDMQFLNRDAFSKLKNLKILDISFNTFKTLTTDTFKDLKLLKMLHIFGNKLLTNIQQGAFNGLTEIRKLSITGTQLKTVVVGTFVGLKLSILNLTYNQILKIEDMAFKDLEVNTIDIRGNDITNFNKDMFTGVRGLRFIYSKAYKFCCVRPSSVNEKDCYPYKDEFVSCEDLMTNNVLQTLIWVIGICAILGNSMSFGYRCLNDKQQMKIGFGIFVTNLAMADFLMGVYLLIIAIADIVYRDRYIWNDDYWRNSIWCAMAGVLSTVASEAGVVFVCLITLDRIIVIKFPFGQIRFGTRSAILCSILIWLLVVFIAVFPLMHKEYFQNQFYAKSGVCLAFPLTDNSPPGWQYLIAVFVGFNSVTFLLITIGQLSIFFEIKRSKKRVNSQSTTKGNDLKVAKNLLLVVATDFLCWFPVGCMGMLASNGYTISGEVYEWAAVFILPFNSVINPFLYTLAGILFKSKFVPRIDEQTGTRQTKFSERGKGIIAIADSRLISLPPTTTNAMTTMSLEKYATNSRVTSSDILTIAVQTTTIIRYVHHCNLVLRTIDITTITAVTLNDRPGLDHIKLNLMPRVCANKNEKMEDMYTFGVIIRKLLNKSKQEQYLLY